MTLGSKIYHSLRSVLFEDLVNLIKISNITFSPADSSVIINWLTDELSDSFVEFGKNPNLMEFNIGNAKKVVNHEMV